MLTYFTKILEVTTMYEIIRIHKPVKEYRNAVEVSTLSTIPEFLREAVALEKHELWLDNEKGVQTAPLGSVIGYEKSDKTISGYNCWFIGNSLDFIQNEGIYSTKPHVLQAMLIPAENEPRPVWVVSSGLTYNDDGTATLKAAHGFVSGRIGIDFIITSGMMKNGKPNANILARYDEDYDNYGVYDENDNIVGKLSELYPA